MTTPQSKQCSPSQKHRTDSVPTAILGDIHTTDLTEPCLRKVLLRHQHKSEPVAPTALFRGLLAGKCLEVLHEKGGKVDVMPLAEELKKELLSEGRMLSDAVEKNLADLCREVDDKLYAYTETLMPKFDKCQVIGTELPCRLNVNGIELASHIDLMVRDTDGVFGYGRGRLLVIDWKYRMETPTRGYLARNLQFSLYWLCALRGKILSYPFAGVWDEYQENAQMIWCHLPYLSPFKRKTTCKDIDGNSVTYLKGDQRPVNQIMRDVNFKTDCVSEIEKDLTERVEMMRAGYFPKSPDPVRCTVCDSREFCTRGDTPELLENK